MPLEKALYITSLGSLKKASPADGYSRVYFGAEFCQWRMPAPATVKKAYSAARDMGLGFTLLTPWVTDAGLKKVRAILKALNAPALESPHAHAHKSPPHPPLTKGDWGALEVVVNDLGVLYLLKEEFSEVFTPVLGRLLVKQKRCPRVPGIIEGLPEAGREVYMRAGVEDPVAAKFLKGFGVKRVELDSPLHGLAADLKAARLKGSIYTPYACVTTTRHCPASFDGKVWQAFTGCRLKGCLKNVIALHNPAHEEPILMRGNTQFVRSGPMPRALSRMGIDRVVYMDDVP
jgi:hypothetical protein